MAEEETQYATAADVAELRGLLEDLRQAQQDMREAETPAERETARRDAAGAKADLDALAVQMGISRAKLQESIDAAKAAERKEQLRPVLRELIEEIRAEEAEAEAAAAAEEKPKVERPKREPKPKEPAEELPPGDEPPTAEHWSERSMGSLLQ